MNTTSIARCLLEPFRKYATFSGRASRLEFWLFVGTTTVLGLITIALDAYFNTWSPVAGIGLLTGVFGIVLVVPSIALSVRRLHDLNLSGWWWLLCLLPVIGPLSVLVMCTHSSATEPTRFQPQE